MNRNVPGKRYPSKQTLNLAQRERNPHHLEAVLPAALVLAVAAIACLIMANMERISDWMACLWAKVQAKKELLCRTCPCEGCESDDEFEEWDI